MYNIHTSIDPLFFVFFVNPLHEICGFGVALFDHRSFLRLQPGEGVELRWTWGRSEIPTPHAQQLGVVGVQPGFSPGEASSYWEIWETTSFWATAKVGGGLKVDNLGEIFVYASWYRIDIPWIAMVFMVFEISEVRNFPNYGPWVTPGYLVWLKTPPRIEGDTFKWKRNGFLNAKDLCQRVSKVS